MRLNHDEIKGRLHPARAVIMTAHDTLVLDDPTAKL
jgi:hypothetical protein